MATGTDVADGATTMWDFLIHVYDNGGVGVLALFALAFLFYKLIWKVWKRAMESKDAEIERLIGERNFYQSRVFNERMTSDVPRQLENEDG